MVKCQSRVTKKLLDGLICRSTTICVTSVTMTLNVEDETGVPKQCVGPEGPSGPSKEAKPARVDHSIRDVESQRSLFNESITKFLAHTCGCGKDCTSFITRKDTLRS